MLDCKAVALSAHKAEKEGIQVNWPPADIAVIPPEWGWF